MPGDRSDRYQTETAGEIWGGGRSTYKLNVGSSRGMRA